VGCRGGSLIQQLNHTPPLLSTLQTGAGSPIVLFRKLVAYPNISFVCPSNLAVLFLSLSLAFALVFFSDAQHFVESWNGSCHEVNKEEEEAGGKDEEAATKRR
jgi:hypothetical protein